MAVPKKKVSRKKRDVRRYNIRINFPQITLDIYSKKFHLRHHYNNIFQNKNIKKQYLLR